MQQEFLKPRLNGERFRDHTVPLELLQDFAALQEMLVEVAKWEFRKAHPERKRIPRNFTAGVDLHLTSVEEGSAVLTISLVFAGLFPASNHLTYFEQARSAIIETIATAEKGETPRLQPHLLNYFDRFGRGLRSGESISFDHGAGKATLSPESRNRLMHYAQVSEWTEEATLRVRIPEADKGRNSFEMELNDGTKLKGDLSNLYNEPILEAFGNYGTGHDEYVLIQGVVRRDRADRLKGLESIEHATPLDPLDITLRLEELAKLQDGWLDGKGRAPAKERLDWLANTFDASFDSDLQLPYLYPTAEGDLQAEWSIDGWEVSLDIDLEKRSGEYQALNLADKTCNELLIPLDSAEGWVQLNAALKQLEKRADEVQS
ncbi:MAG: hypothetical protein M3O31_06910 [Acidobacteriota bacterium]|nr:hypothetical protein [Acidobacteriota bacterium]